MQVASATGVARQRLARRTEAAEAVGDFDHFTGEQLNLLVNLIGEIAKLASKCTWRAKFSALISARNVSLASVMRLLLQIRAAIARLMGMTTESTSVSNC
jgi:hypothetical protein